jgi:hypothetical protein
MKRISHFLLWQIPKPALAGFYLVGGGVMLFWAVSFAIHGRSGAALIFGLLALVCFLRLRKPA